MKRLLIASFVILLINFLSTFFIKKIQKKPQFLVVVPLDGVVVETNGAFWPAVKEALELNGIEFQGFDPELLYALTGQSLSSVCQHLSERFNLKTDLLELEQTLSQLILKNLEKNTQPVAGFEDFVQSCQSIGCTVIARTGMAREHFSVLDKKFKLREKLGNRLYLRGNGSTSNLLLDIAKSHSVDPSKCIVLCKRSVDTGQYCSAKMRAVLLNYTKSVQSDGSVVAYLKPFDQIFGEIKQIVSS